MREMTDIECIDDLVIESGTGVDKTAWKRIKKKLVESCQQSGEAPVQQLKAEIAYMANQLEVCCHNNLFMLLPEYVNKLRQLSAV